MASTTRSTDMPKTQPLRRAALLAAMTLIALFVAAPAQAAFHLVVIQEVFLGTPGDGTARPVPLTADQKAQYVMMRMTSSGQTILNGTSLRVEDANGVVLGTFGSFTANISNGGAACSYPNCPAFIIGTQAAKNLFTFTFDKIVDGQAGRVALPVAGGRVCFVSGTQVVDCVAWGSFNCTVAGTCTGANTLRTGDTTANGCDTNWGAPAAAPGYGFVLERSAAFSCAAKTNSTDYTKLFPKPVNNAGTNNNTDTDADGLIDQLDCNDASTGQLWPPVEIQNERVLNASPGTITWDSQSATTGIATAYDVLRGHLSHLNGFTDGSCIVLNTASTSVNDGTTPAAGDGFYYVERAEGCTQGTWGSGFAPATSRDTILNALCP